MDKNEEFLDKLGDVIDNNNIASGDSTVYDKDINIIDEIKITSAMKILFILFGVIGAGFSLYTFGFFQFFVWVLAVIFIADMLGIFDKLRNMLRESQKPRGGYESIG